MAAKIHNRFSEIPGHSTQPYAKVAIIAESSSKIMGHCTKPQAGKEGPSPSPRPPGKLRSLHGGRFGRLWARI